VRATCRAFTALLRHPTAFELLFCGSISVSTLAISRVAGGVFVAIAHAPASVMWDLARPVWAHNGGLS
jgi:hypothetical protein